MTSSYNMSRDFKPVNIAILTVSDTRTSTTDKSGTYLSNAVEDAGPRDAIILVLFFIL